MLNFILHGFRLVSGGFFAVPTRCRSTLPIGPCPAKPSGPVLVSQPVLDLKEAEAFRDQVRAATMFQRVHVPEVPGEPGGGCVSVHQPVQHIAPAAMAP